MMYDLRFMIYDFNKPTSVASRPLRAVNHASKMIPHQCFSGAGRAVPGF
jgi:hypothetical protein